MHHIYRGLRTALVNWCWVMFRWVEFRVELCLGGGLYIYKHARSLLPERIIQPHPPEDKWECSEDFSFLTATKYLLIAAPFSSLLSHLIDWVYRWSRKPDEDYRWLSKVRNNPHPPYHPTSHPHIAILERTFPVQSSTSLIFSYLTGNLPWVTLNTSLSAISGPNDD